MKEKIKRYALSLGFSAVGISKAEELSEEARRLESWLEKGMHGEMHYMEENFDKRIDPRKILPNCQTVISVIANYFTPQNEMKGEVVREDEAVELENLRGKISIYAQRKDYHQVIKEKLYQLFEFVCECVGEVNGRAFVDSAPMLDKAWAARAGLGWMGKHSNLINRSIGSYFFIGNLLLDCRLEPDAPLLKDYCGTCTACIDSCPTKAIIAPYQVDARRCISYLTIELKREFTDEEKAMLGEWLFGCDICQEVCPWTRFSKPTVLLEFAPKPEVEHITEKEILEMTKSSFKRIFGDTPVFRTGLRRLKRNAKAVQENLNSELMAKNTVQGAEHAE
ncbi:MAG: tRNA epoxyqueuosine(34) reductase QueG [Chloroherpetonaceae bacterium]|nr:tRNA epoxyqueuosine(34) reductase QueG [Chloroherpetonaceae bacterium]